MNKFIITENDANQTIFKFLKKAYSNTPLSVIYKWFRKKDIKVNNKRINDQKLILNIGDEVIVFDSNKTVKRDNFKYIKNVKLDVVYEDQNLIIVYKEPNIEMHSEFNKSLDDMVKSYLFDNGEYNPEEESSFVVSHVHRLDKLTQGIVMYAKNKQASIILLEAIQDKNKIGKEYVLLTKKGFPNNMDAQGFIKYDPEEQKSFFNEIQVDQRMKDAHTKFNLISEDDKYSLVNAKLETGRKHQIRATLSYFKFPIVNDFKYHGVKLNNERMIYLKAYKLSFNNLEFPLDYLNGHVVEIEKEF